MIKKVLKIAGILFILLILIIIALPFVFGGTIKDKIKYLANEQLHAQVDFADVDISLFRSFPQASVVIDELSVINKAPFEGDTLAYAKKLALDVSITELFKSAEETIGVQQIIVDDAVVNVKVDSLGNANYDIAKKQTEIPTTPEEEGGAFAFDLKHYEINNGKIVYSDKSTKTELILFNLNHSGDGTVSGDKILLDTKSKTEASFGFGGTEYLSKNPLQLDAIIELDLKNQKYTFKENKALINQLPLEFNGFVQLSEKYTDVDLSFKTPSSDFKNFLAVIPAVYTKNLDGVQTSGDFVVDGIIKGKVDEEHIPTMDIKISSNNASFKYPDLPKSVRNINIDAALKNTTGLLEDTYINIGNLTFRIDEDVFAAKGSFKRITENMLVDLALKGTLNLENLDKAYPMELEQKLNGIVKADVKTNFDMASLEKEQYQKVKSTGTISLQNFKYKSPEIPNELQIADASVDFKPGTITLDKMKATTGKSDLTAQGKIENFMGFLFAKQDLKGNFDVSSDVFAVDDFMVADAENKTKEEEKSTTPEESLKIPSFLDATLNFTANKVLYDNLELRNTKGTVKIKDETAYMQNVKSNIFEGGLAFDGNVSTKSETPTFDMKLDLSKIDIAKSFSQMELLKGLAPIAKALTGALTTEIKLNGDLNKDLTPVLTSIKGDALAEILNAKVSTAKTPLLSKLDSQMNFLDLDKLDLKNIKTALNFSDGKINVKPTEFDIKGIKIKASGSHGFDMNMNYNLALDVPAKYLGSETSGLIAQLSDQEANEMKVALPVGISGSFSDPKINLNTGQAVKQLTQQIVAKQKEKAKDKIKDKGKELIGGLLGGTNKKDTDTTTTETTNKEDPKDKLKDAATDILGGFLGGKKKKKKDTTGSN